MAVPNTRPSMDPPVILGCTTKRYVQPIRTDGSVNLGLDFFEATDAQVDLDRYIDMYAIYDEITLVNVLQYHCNIYGQLHNDRVGMWRRTTTGLWELCAGGPIAMRPSRSYVSEEVN